jgi:hypothetical protein
MMSFQGSGPINHADQTLTPEGDMRRRPKRHIVTKLRRAGNIAVLALVVMAAGGCGGGLKSALESLAAPPSAAPQFDFVSALSTTGCPSTACSTILAKVVAAATTNTIPPGLTPSLQHGSTDVRRPPGGDCSQVPIPGPKPDQDEDSEMSDACTYSTEVPATAPMIVLIGNSHAHMWSVPIGDIAKQLGYRFGLIYHAACHLALAKFSGWPPYATEPRCRAWQDAAGDWVNQQNPAVVLAATGDGADIKVSDAADYAAGYAAALKKMQAPGRKLFVMGAVPFPSQDPTHCLSAHSSFILRCATPTSLATPAYAQQAMLDAARQAGADYVNVTPFLCTPDICPAVIGHYLAYSDRYHLTTTYAQTLTPVIQQALNLRPAGIS